MKKLIFVLYLCSCYKVDIKNEINKVKASSLVSSSLSTVTPPLLPVIVLCGQSNMEGGDPDSSNTSDTFTSVFRRAFIAFKPSRDIKQPDIVIQQLQYGINNNFRDYARRFGPEEGIAYYYGKRIGIIKYAYAGSMLNDKRDSVKDGTGHWQIDAIAEDGPVHYYNLINNWIIPSFAAYRALGFTPYIAAFVWCQGEADSKTELAANNYQINLTNLLNQFKIDVHPIDSLSDNMKVIITRTRYSCPGQWLSKVRAAQEIIASTYPNASLISSDNFPVIGGGIHYTRNAQANMHGKKIAEIISQ